MRGFIIPLTEEEFEAKMDAAVQRAFEKYSVTTEREKYLTRKEVAERLRISLPTLHAHIRKGIIKSHNVGGRVLFLEDEIEAIVSSGQSIKYRRS